MYDSHKTMMAMKKPERTKTDKDVTAAGKVRLKHTPTTFQMEHCDEDQNRPKVGGSRFLLSSIFAERQ